MDIATKVVTVTPKTGTGTGRRASWQKPKGRNRNTAEQRAVLAKIRRLVIDKGMNVTAACCAVEVSDGYYYTLVKKFRKGKKTAPKTISHDVKVRMTVKTLSPKERLAAQDERIASLAKAVELMSRQVEKLVKDWS